MLFRAPGIDTWDDIQWLSDLANKLTEAWTIWPNDISVTEPVAVEWLSPLPHFREATGLNLGIKASCRDWSFSLFSSVPPG